jgi:hypothetical protein
MAFNQSPMKCGFHLVVTAGAGRRAAELRIAGTAQRGRAIRISVRIAVVRMQHDWRSSIPVHGIAPDQWFMTPRIGECIRAREHGPSDQCYHCDFHGLSFRVVTQTTLRKGQGGVLSRRSH